MDPVYSISASEVDLFDCFSKITGRFEGRQGFSNLAGNFDGMGISAGVLQWNLGCGSLQPMLAEMLSMSGYSGSFATEFAELAASSKTAGVELSLQYQTNNKLHADFKQAMVALLTDPASVNVQKKYMRKVYAVSSKLVTQFGFDEDSLLPHLFFFDLVTNSGSMKTVTPSQIDALFEDGGQAVLSELVAYLQESGGEFYTVMINFYDNLDLLQEEQLRLLVIGYERAKLSSPQWRLMAYARRAAIAMCYGYVNKELISIMDILGLQEVSSNEEPTQ